MVVIFYVLADLNMFANVLEDGLKTVSHYAVISKRIQHD